jgi:hypothetical protein
VILETKQKEEGGMGKFGCTVYVLVLLIVGCAGIETRKQMTLFDETSRAYGRAIRWGEYEEAFAFKRLAGQDDNLPDFAEYRQIRVTSYKIKKTRISEDFSKVLQIVDVQYYRMSNVTVKNFIDRQKWEYNEEENRWYLTSEFPDFE